jgi:hypothetical protein
MSNVDDVEKRWRNPAAFRSALGYVAVVTVVAVLVFTLQALVGAAGIWWAAATPAVLFVGALGAFVKTYRVWRAGGTWPIWHGAGWFLLASALATFGLPLLTVSGIK